MNSTMNSEVVKWWASYSLKISSKLEMLRMQSLPLDGPAIYQEYELAENVPLITRGPRKGKKNYEAATGRHVVRITVQEIPQVIATYEGVTGKCHRCNGTGQMWVKWNHVDGNTFSTCKACDGTGKPKPETIAAS